jgi:hypothetical protein
MKMNIVELVEGGRRLTCEPESVGFGYYSPVDGQRVDDPPEVHQAIMRAGGSREVTWAEARPALIALDNKRAAHITVYWKKRSEVFLHQSDGWLSAPVESRRNG